MKKKLYYPKTFDVSTKRKKLTIFSHSSLESGKSTNNNDKNRELDVKTLSNPENNKYNLSTQGSVISPFFRKKKNPYLLSPSTILSRPLAPAIKQWLNSLYSFNQNFTKTLPTVDSIVNKIIKSFFSINPLANNPKGKKSRLVVRRFKRLSLNRIFVSKPEIKHTNDKVFVTVYLFNKKKKSLLYKLRDLYEDISFRFSAITSSNKSIFRPFHLGMLSPKKIDKKRKVTKKVKNQKKLTKGKKVNNTKKVINGKKLKNHFQPSFLLKKDRLSKNGKALAENSKIKNRYSALKKRNILSKNEINKFRKQIMSFSKLKNTKNKLQIIYFKIRKVFISRSKKQTLKFKTRKVLISRSKEQALKFKIRKNSVSRSKEQALDSIIRKVPVGSGKKQALDSIIRKVPVGSGKKQALKFKTRKNSVSRSKKQSLDSIIRKVPVGSSKKRTPVLKKRKIFNSSSKKHTLALKKRKNINSSSKEQTLALKKRKNINSKNKKRNNSRNPFKLKARHNWLVKLWKNNRNSARLAALVYRNYKKKIGKSNNLYRFMKKSKKTGKEGFGFQPSSYRNNRYRLKHMNFYSKRSKKYIHNKKFIVIRNTKSRIANNKRLSALLKKKISLFINILKKKRIFPLKKANKEFQPLKSNKLDNRLVYTKNSKVLKKYYKALNKYRLDRRKSNVPLAKGNHRKKKYNLYLIEKARKHRNLVRNKKIISFKRSKLTMSMQKLKALYKLFTTYHNLYFHFRDPRHNAMFLNNKGLETLAHGKTLKKMSFFSKRILVNAYKLLKKSFSCEASKRYKKYILSMKKKYPLALAPKNKKNLVLSKIDKPGKKFLTLYAKNKLKTYKSRMLWLKKIKGKKNSRRYVKRTIKNRIIFKRISRINRFFKKYKKNIVYSNNSFNSRVVNNIATMYKLNFIREIINKELLYIYYIKMLSFNNTVFKSWFLNSLTNILSKIYNKKVILNLVSLKYIHLNSDIFTQAIAIRLRNFKKNRLNKVLRKALKLIALSKINISSYDIHSPVNRFIEQYYNKFKYLNKHIFKDLRTLPVKSRSLTLKQHNKDYSKKVYIKPIKKELYKLKPMKSLNSKVYRNQSNTIRFIRHKSAFGIRLEAAGRLTKRSTASRAIFKIRYKGSLRNNITLNRSDTSTSMPDQRISNLQFTKISSKTRNGSFGLKGWLNNN